MIDTACLLRTARLLLAGAVCVLSLGVAGAVDEDSAPERVARLGYTSGRVSFSPAGSDDWVEANPNRPLTSGDRVWVEQDGRAELYVGASAVRLAGGSALELLEVGDRMLAVKLTQGSLVLRARDLDDDEDIEISTPNLAFEVRSDGEFRADVDPDRNQTTLGVRRGRGMAYGADGERQRLALSAGQRLRVDGRDLFPLENGGLGPRDEFERWAAARDARDDAAESARYVSRGMPGYQDLDAHGDWRQTPAYGAVWIPRVRITGWAPYQFGRWVWVSPWGWTWIDDAPWGFAPFHYGRWVRIDANWCWVPGPRVARPVYAPALVAFVGGTPGWSVSVRLGGAGIGWFALGPNEPYRPPYARNPRYVTRINAHIVVRDLPREAYVNARAPHGVAVMRADAFSRGERFTRHPHVDGPDLPRADIRFDAPVARGNAPRTVEARREAPPERSFRAEVVRPRVVLDRVGRDEGFRTPREMRNPPFAAQPRDDDRSERRQDGHMGQPANDVRQRDGERNERNEPAPRIFERQRRDERRDDRREERREVWRESQREERREERQPRREERREESRTPVVSPPPAQIERKPAFEVPRQPSPTIEERVPRMRQPEQRNPEPAPVQARPAPDRQEMPRPGRIQEGESRGRGHDGPRSERQPGGR